VRKKWGRQTKKFSDLRRKCLMPSGCGVLWMIKKRKNIFLTGKIPRKAFVWASYFIPSDFRVKNISAKNVLNNISVKNNFKPIIWCELQGFKLVKNTFYFWKNNDVFLRIYIFRIYSIYYILRVFYNSSITVIPEYLNI